MKNKKTLIYYIPYSENGGNFGDELNPLIANKLLDNPDCFNIAEGYDCRRGGWIRRGCGLTTMSMLGSVLHTIPDKSYIWGTGHNPNYKRVPKNCKVFATRGPLSMQYLNDHGYSLKANDVAFGDPALLIPRLFPEWLTPRNTEHDVTLILHHNDIKFQKDSGKHINVISCSDGLDFVIDTIRKSKKIISSSLHGVIVAEMLNKEAVWLQLPESKKSETDAKYQDYYQSTGRYDIIPAKTLEEAMEMKVAKPIYDDTRLYESFYRCYEYVE